MNARARWTTAICGMLSFPVLLYGFAFSITTNDPSFRVDRGYKQRTESYDLEMRQRAVNARLGWNVTVGCEATRGVLTVRLTDAEAVPIAGAAVEVEVFHAARSARSTRLVLVEGSPGEYSAAYDPRHRGQYVARVAAARFEDAFAAERRFWVDSVE